MSEKGKGRRVVRNSTDKERTSYRKALAEERIGMEANKRLGREAQRTRRELSATVSELKSIREELGISLTDLADRTGTTIGNLSRLENMDGSNPTIETLRRCVRGIGRPIEIAVVTGQ